jgi:UDP-glucose 4-epimerase
MTSVLVTCASASPGLELCRALATHMPVLACGAEPEAALAPLLEESGIHYLQADLSHSRQRRAVLFGPALDARVDAVVHAPSCDPRRPHGAADTLRELIHLCERHPTIRRFVYRGSAEVYRSGPADPAVIDEEHPVEPDDEAPPWLRDLVEADQAACAHIGGSRLRIAVLRCAELFAPKAGGQLLRWLDAEPCLRPLGFDPIVNLISREDLVRAVSLALRSPVAGVFNIKGADTLPLSELAVKAGRRCVPLPGWVLSPAYRLRALLKGPSFDYPTNRPKFHFGGVLSGRAALLALGYQPRTPIRWGEPAVSPPPAVATVSREGPAGKARSAGASVLQARA